MTVTLPTQPTCYCPNVSPAANSPQAWSASTVVALLQALLGLQPYAPLGLLLVDPHLPPWLPRITLRGVRVGNARVDLQFHRDADGRSHHEVLAQTGELEVRLLPSPWSLTSAFGADLRAQLHGSH